jgi:hypothetical protein
MLVQGLLRWVLLMELSENIQRYLHKVPGFQQLFSRQRQVLDLVWSC